VLRALAILTALILGAGAVAQAAGPFESAPPAKPESPIDKLVFANLQKAGIEPANLCSDPVFVRRVYLEIIGTLPTAQEAGDFIKDKNPDKRRLLIDRLLEKDEFADYWSMKWADLLRVKAEFPVNLWPNAVQAYHRWIRVSLKENKPYDRFVRELLTASGSNFRDPAVNFCRAVPGKEPKGIAQTVALTFMGMRTDSWPKERLEGMAVFFSQVGFKSTGEWKEEIVFWDPSKVADKAGDKPLRAVFPDGSEIVLPAGRDPREVFADWLVSPKNSHFNRAIANRVWSWLIGRGIVHEPDDIRPDNPPVNPELLAYLEQELVAGKYDLKHLFRLILNSQTYQLSSVPRTKGPKAEAHFASYPLRRLEAEVLIDAIDQITGGTEKYSSPIPEPFTFIPENQRSIILADGSITSPFLEMFGRPSRDTGLEGERNNRPSPAQRLHMLNSSQIQKKIEDSPALKKMMQAKGPPRQIVGNLYMTIVSRPPTEEELKIAEAYCQNKSGREPYIDIAWALFNSAEFLYRH
jgi:hypothetical protein